MTADARVVRGHDAVQARPLMAKGPSQAQWRRVAREEIEGRLAAERIVQEAHAEADAIVARAKADASEAARTAAEKARANVETEMVSRWLAVRNAEHKRTAATTEQVVALAIALAERLLGAALELTPAHVAELARTVITEARGARRAVMDAHPSDAAALREHLTIAGLDVQSVEVREDAALQRGDLRLHTDVGTIDARLAPRFERLASALRDALE